MLHTLLSLIAVVVIVFVVLAATQSSTFRVTRSALIAAPAAVVFAQVNELQNWKAWSPWAGIDPNATSRFEGPTEGVGAKMIWVSNVAEVGTGSMTITDSQPSATIRFRLDFQKPMRATNTAEFNFQPEGDQTLVSWSMNGTNGFIGKAMSLVFNCDKMVGGKFEKGLANLKAVVEPKR